MIHSLSDLLSAEAVRFRSLQFGQAAMADHTRWFDFNKEILPDCISLVAGECQQNYPTLAIPYHSRWRHFVVGDYDLWHHYRQKQLADIDPAAATRSAIDLVFISVLLDAGAGDHWHFSDPVSGQVLNRSEGLAAASLALFFDHLAVRDSDGGLSVSAEALMQCNEQLVAAAFQHDGSNPLVGIAGRTALLNGLGKTLASRRDGDFYRPGNLYDMICLQYPERRISAGQVLKLVLKLFNTMWPAGMVQQGVHLGDCGEYSFFDDGGIVDRIVPFHKLSQWLTYSLLEPLQWGGIEVTELNQLTGLPEYRNGGLLIDTGVLQPKDPVMFDQILKVSSEQVVEWRALTVWLLDEIANGVREKFCKSPEELPLASVLQGGTWSAGRKLAMEKRGGLPPLNLEIQGTVF